MNKRYCGLLLIAAAILASCAQDDSVSDRVQFESNSIALDREVRSEISDQVMECAQHNGVDADEVRSYTDAVAPRSTEIFEESAPLTFEQVRRQMSEVGYRVVLSTEDAARFRAEFESSGQLDELDEQTRRIMELGPITEPVEGETFDGGCNSWASDLVRSNDQFSGAVQQRDERATRVGERVENSPEMALLNLEWARCMAEAGYPDFEEMTEAIGTAFGYMNRVRSGEWTLDFGLAREIELALADFDCQVAIDADNRRQAVFDEAFGSTSEDQ